LLVHRFVEDYAKWKPVFDAHAAARTAGGMKEGLLFRGAENPNEIVVLWETDDLEKTRQFAMSDTLREAMQQGGVVGRPDACFLEEVEKLGA
jgi:hypothetical protein